MGRDRRNEAHHEQFTKMIRRTMETEAWRALPPISQAAYPWLKMEWKGPQANNNGRIRVSVRQLAECLGCSINTAARALHPLQAKGFIVVTEGARLGLSGEAKSPAFEITELDMPGRSHENRARKLFLQWRPGHDFPVCKASANNPKGVRSKTKPHHNYCDVPVSNIVTFREMPSQKL